MKKITMIAVVLIGMINLSTAQQVGQGIDPWFNKTPQTHNMSLIYLNAVPTVSFTAGSRLDAFNNNPTEGTLLASGFLMDGVGVGCKINREQAGLSSHIDAQLAFAYRVFLNEKGDKLAFFLGGHFTQDQLATNEAILIDANDPSLQNVSMIQPNGNASAGFSFLRENKYYAGISTYQLLENKNTFMNSALTNKTQRTYYFVGAYTFGLNEKLDLELTSACLFANAKTYTWDAGFNIKFNKMFWTGIGYRSAGAIKFNAGITAQSWSFGYLCSYGSWVDATNYTYKSMHNAIFVRKIFNEGRGNKGKT